VRAWDGTHFCPIKTAVYGARCPVYASGAYRFAVTEYQTITGRPAPAVAVLPPNLVTATITERDLALQAELKAALAKGGATSATSPTTTTTRP
jgi:hypothetical protein